METALDNVKFDAYLTSKLRCQFVNWMYESGFREEIHTADVSLGSSVYS